MPLIRTGYAKRPDGTEYLFRIPETRPAVPGAAVESIALLPRHMRSNTYDRVIDAAIHLLTKRRVYLLERERTRLTDRAWAIYQESRALVECTRALRGR